jgi:hypothetical protein
MSLIRISKGVTCLATVGALLLLFALVPLGNYGSNIGFWIGLLGFTRLAALIPKEADFWFAAIGLFSVTAAAGPSLLALLDPKKIVSQPEIRERRNWLEQRLIDSVWELIYDPENNLSKPLSFEPDGMIGQGQDKNHRAWAVSGKYLELYRESGLLQNRFEFHPSGERLIVVRDPKAMGTKGQFIRRRA